MKKYQYEIFQTDAKQEFAFMSWRSATKHGWSFDPYQLVWSGKEDAGEDLDLLDFLYEVFNERRPDDFKGHSLSVSDIIEVREMDGVDAEPTFYYCDSFGWEDITESIATWERK